MADGDFLSGIGSGLSALGQGAGKLLSNPLAQAALGTYFGAIGTPRYEGLGGAISRGGLAGLGTYEQARQAELQEPILQFAGQQAKAAMAPLTKEQSDQLGRLKASAVMTDPLTGKTTPDVEGQQHIGQLESMYRGKLIDANTFVQALSHYDESKRMSNLWNAQSKMMMAQMYPALMQQFGLMPQQQSAQPMLQAPPAAPAPSMAPSGGKPGRYSPQVIANLKTWAAQAKPDGSAFLSGMDGKWHQMNPDGTQGPLLPS